MLIFRSNTLIVRGNVTRRISESDISGVLGDDSNGIDLLKVLVREQGCSVDCSTLSPNFVTAYIYIYPLYSHGIDSTVILS